MSHTPGPWGIMGRSVGVNPNNSMTWSGFATVSGYGAESDANLSLIAAAPEMLEALRAIFPFVEEDDGFYATTPGYQKAIDMVRAAIAKAERTPESPEEEGKCG